MIQAQIGTALQSEIIANHMAEYFNRFPSYRGRFTDLEWYHIFLDFFDTIEQKAPQIAALQSELSQTRAELEQLKMRQLKEFGKEDQEQLTNTVWSILDETIHLGYGSTGQPEVVGKINCSQRIALTWAGMVFLYAAANGTNRSATVFAFGIITAHLLFNG